MASVFCIKNVRQKWKWKSSKTNLHEMSLTLRGATGVIVGPLRDYSLLYSALLLFSTPSDSFYCRLVSTILYSTRLFSAILYSRSGPFFISLYYSARLFSTILYSSGPFFIFLYSTRLFPTIFFSAVRLLSTIPSRLWLMPPAFPGLDVRPYRHQRHISPNKSRQICIDSRTIL